MKMKNAEAIQIALNPWGDYPTETLIQAKRVLLHGGYKNLADRITDTINLKKEVSAERHSKRSGKTK